MAETSTFPGIDADALRERILGESELALIDVREARPYAGGHILYAANLPLGRLDLLVARALPRHCVPIVLCDAGEGLAEQAADRLSRSGYRDTRILRAAVEVLA